MSNQRIYSLAQKGISDIRRWAIFDEKEVFNPESIKISTFKEMLDDAGILFPLLILKLPIIRMPWHITCSDPDIKNFLTQTLLPIWDHFIWQALTGLEFGFSGMEIRWYQDNGYWKLKKFLSMDPEYLTIRTTKNGSFNGLVQEFKGVKTAIPVHKSFIYSHDFRFGYLYGRSRLRSAYRYWLLDKFSYINHGRYSGKLAIPTVLGRAPAGVSVIGTNPENGETITKANLDIVQEMGESIANASTISLLHGEEWSLKYLEEMRSKIYDFNADHDHNDKLKARAIFVPEEIAFGGSGGSYAKAKEHSYWLTLAIESLIKSIGNEFLVPYVLDKVVRANFPAGEGTLPKVRMVFEPIDRSLLEFIQKVFLQSMSDSETSHIDFEELFKRFRIPTTKAFETQSVSGGIREALKEATDSQDYTKLKKVFTIQLRRSLNNGINLGKEELSYFDYVNMEASDHKWIDQISGNLLDFFKTEVKELNGDFEKIFFGQVESFNQLALLRGKSKVSKCLE